MAKGFDPKWSLTTLFCAMRGMDGLATFAGDKGGQLTAQGSVAISRACADFPEGAAYFGNPVAIQALYPTTQSFSYAEQAVEIEFHPTSFGASGRRYLCTVINRFELYFDVAAARLQLDFWPNGSTLQSHYAAVDLASLVGKASKAILRISLTHLSVELNGTTLFNNPHGVTTFSNTSGSVFRIGNSGTGSAAHNWYGYIGPIRRTVGDLRAEETSAIRGTMYPLGALDTYREKVAFHSHFDGLGGATTTTELSSDRSISFTGSAALSTSSSQFGPSCISLAGGTAYCDGIDFSAQKFTIEFWEKRTENDGTNRYIFSIMDEAGVDHALSVASPYFGPVTLRKNGADVATSDNLTTGPKTIWQHWAVVRDGDHVAVFVAGVRSLLVDIGASPLLSNGRFVIGKGGSVAPAAASTDWIDECRITVGEARYNVNSLSITPPTERFNEYGPHSMRGTVKRMVSGNAVISPGSLVAAFDRTTLSLVSRDVSAADGSFELPSAHGDEHFVLAFDDDMNLVGYDKILPAIFS